MKIVVLVFNCHNVKKKQQEKFYLGVSFSDGVKSDRSNHLVVLHLFEVAAVALCGDTTCIV